MARYKVVFDQQATADLTEIRDYIASKREREFADAFVGRLVRYCESMAVVPHRGTKRDDIRPGLRTVTWRRTITIAFRVRDDIATVVVAGAFYRGRDIATVLKTRP